MIDADYLRRQAEACQSLSRATFDLAIAGRLRAMADELRRKAQELDESFDGFAAPMRAASRRAANGSNGHDTDRN